MTQVEETGTGEIRSEGLFHVVLLNDDDHSHEYVIEMLGALFFLPAEVAYRQALEVHGTGRSIIVTCELPQAEFARDQIQSYGKDRRIPECQGSMSARVEPA